MELIDLTREIHHKMQRLVNHPTIEVYPFSTHDEKRIADGYEFSSATLVLHMGDHGGTHVDAPVHFDERPGAKTVEEMPLETFFTEAVCLDLPTFLTAPTLPLPNLKLRNVRQRLPFSRKILFFSIRASISARQAPMGISLTFLG